MWKDEEEDSEALLKEKTADAQEEVRLASEEEEEPVEEEADDDRMEVGWSWRKRPRIQVPHCRLRLFVFALRIQQPSFVKKTSMAS